MCIYIYTGVYIYIHKYVYYVFIIIICDYYIFFYDDDYSYVAAASQKFVEIISVMLKKCKIVLQFVKLFSVILNLES